MNKFGIVEKPQSSEIVKCKIFLKWGIKIEKNENEGFQLFM